ncbi:MAG: efflux RND transporter periplasmic adaptor subunit [Verrucomicrobia bacterium]|nr:efflux RND transporter periplasmic adaptor subunit [Verrucomicrobiota bacterium]
MNPSFSENSAVKPGDRSNHNRHSRRWLPYAGAVLIVAILVAGLWPQPVPVETARATLGTLRSSIDEEGRTRLKQRYTVSAPVSGQLRRIDLKPGAEVRADETVVAVIDPLPPAMLDARSRSLAEARRDTALASLEKARAAHRFAASELRRFEKLYADKTVPIQELETVQLRESSAAKDKAAAESALRQAEAELAEFLPGSDGKPNSSRTPTEVKSPATGCVLRVVEESARVVTAGVSLLEVGDPKELEVVIEVLSRDGAAILPGARVELDQWGGSEPLQAKVRLVEPSAFTKISALGVEEQRVNVIADLITPAEQRRSLGDNFRVEARIIVWETDQALKVPSGALFRRGPQWAVFVVSEGRARLRPVNVGRASGAETQIVEGLKEGDAVILYPGDRVRDGQHVRQVKI